MGLKWGRCTISKSSVPDVWNSSKDLHRLSLSHSVLLNLDLHYMKLNREHWWAGQRGLIVRAVLILNILNHRHSGILSTRMSKFLF